MDKFVHLDVQSAYSFLWGSFTPDLLVKRVKEKGQKAVALTDIWSLQGAIRFTKSAKREGIHPILGARVTLWDGSWANLIATSRRGYANLCRLISQGLRNKKNGPARLFQHELRKNSDGLICILIWNRSSSLKNLVYYGLEAAAISLLPLREIFRERLYLGIKGPFKGDMTLDDIKRLCNKTAISPVAVNSVAFLSRHDYPMHKILIDIQKRHHHRNVESLPDDSFYLAPEKEMRRMVPWDEAIRNSVEITSWAKNFTLSVGRLHPPSQRPESHAFFDLAKTAFRRLARNGPFASCEYISQLDKELEIIKKKGLSDFFLLVKEVVDFAKSQGIRHSARGSAVGSLLVSLLLGSPDPLAHGLLFERFINEGRGDMPDVDIDFDSERRDEVISYVMERFRSKAAMVSTIHTFKTRSAVRLTAKAMGFSERDLKAITRPKREKYESH